jgi:hypothetical protein
MKKRKNASKDAKGGAPPSQLIDARIAELGDWRGETPGPHSHQAGRPPCGRGVEVERGSGVGARRNHLHGETYKAVVKLTFAKGAALEDPSRLFKARSRSVVKPASSINALARPQRKSSTTL